MAGLLGRGSREASFTPLAEEQVAEPERPVGRTHNDGQDGRGATRKSLSPDAALHSIGKSAAVAGQLNRGRIAKAASFNALAANNCAEAAGTVDASVRTKRQDMRAQATRETNHKMSQALDLIM